MGSDRTKVNNTNWGKNGEGWVWILWGFGIGLLLLAKFLDLKMFEAKHKLAKKDSAEMKGVIKHLNSVDWRKKLQWSREALIEIKEEVVDQTDLCEKHTDRIKILEEEQKIIQDQLNNAD